MERLILSVEDGFTLEKACYLVSDGMIEIFLPPFSAAVLRTRRDEKNQGADLESCPKKRTIRRWLRDSGKAWKHRD